MDKVLNKINTLGGLCVTILTRIFGIYWFLFLAYLALQAVDFLTGTWKARKLGTESSAKGAEGAKKKVGYWLVIAIAFFIAFSFERMGNIIGINLSFLSLIGWLTLAIYVINEIRSVLENLVVIGVNVPDFLVKGLEVASNTVNKAAGGKEYNDESIY